MNNLPDHITCIETREGKRLEQPFSYSWMPKAASTSIFIAIAKHVGVKVTRRDAPRRSDWTGFEVGPSELNGFYFTVVRNTYDRIASFWKMRTIRDLGIGDFNTWLRESIHNLVLNNEHFRCQASRLSRIPTFVGRFDNLEEDWKFIRSRTGLPELEHYNKTGVDYKEVYNEESRLRVESYFAREIDTFGFKFEGYDK